MRAIIAALVFLGCANPGMTVEQREAAKMMEQAQNIHEFFCWQSREVITVLILLDKAPPKEAIDEYVTLCESPSSLKESN